MNKRNMELSDKEYIVPSDGKTISVEVTSNVDVSVELPADVNKTLLDRTDPTWPSTWFAPICTEGATGDVYNVMANWGANHGAFVYGHIGEDLVDGGIVLSAHQIDGGSGIQRGGARIKLCQGVRQRLTVCAHIDGVALAAVPAGGDGSHLSLGVLYML